MLNKINDNNLIEQTEEEIQELKRLLKEANDRYRRMLKITDQQSWFDWVLEKIGY